MSNRRSLLLRPQAAVEVLEFLHDNDWDFLVVSHQKSGRTWLRVMLEDLGVCAGYAHFRFDSRDDWNGIPIVFIHRDPRDVVVSYYFHKTRRDRDYSGSLAEFIRDPEFGIEQIARYNAAWLSRGPAAADRFYPITYEDMTVDTSGVLQKLTEFFNLDVTAADIGLAVQRNTFEKMKAREAEDQYNGNYDGTLSPGDGSDPESFKVRRGKVGGYRNYLDDKDLQYCDRVIAEVQG